MTFLSRSDTASLSFEPLDYLSSIALCVDVQGQYTVKPTGGNKMPQGRSLVLTGLIIALNWIKTLCPWRTSKRQTKQTHMGSQKTTRDEPGGRAHWHAAFRHRGKTVESTGSNFQQDVSAGQPRFTHPNRNTCRVCYHVSLAAPPAPGSSLMHVHCMLEPLGTAPSGSVCLVHEQAFTEVPMTALSATPWDWQAAMDRTPPFSAFIKSPIVITPRNSLSFCPLNKGKTRSCEDLINM